MNDRESPRRVLGGRRPEAFFADHWQKSPLLIRDAVDVTAAAPSPGRLLELAMSGRADARWFQRDERGLPQPAASPQLDATHPPPQRLPGAGWTVLLQEADRHLAPCRALLETFRFVPNWRLDDVMVSLSSDGGGVGPHVDRYDVFLIQMAGRRRWSIGTEPLLDPRLSRETALPVLEPFEPDLTFELEAGDALYLPPGLPHDGVSLGDGITCSVGFRVPDPRELWSGYLRQLPPRRFEAIRYGDPDLTPPERLGELTPQARERLRSGIRDLADDASFDAWLGQLLTRPTRAALEAGARAARDARELEARLSAGATLQRSAPAHFLWFVAADGRVRLCVAGEIYELGESADDRDFAERLCGATALDGATLAEDLSIPTRHAILTDLTLRGALQLCSH